MEEVREAKEEVKEAKEEVKEVKEEVKEAKKEVREAKEEVREVKGTLKDVAEELENVLRRDEKEEDKIGIADVLIQKLTSRKMLVFIIGTICLFLGKVDAEQWTIISGIYIGSLSVLEIVTNWKNNKEGSA